MKSIFDEKGFLSETINNYEFRNEQLKMAEFIYEKLLENNNLIIEAGTGTGKSAAYLAASIKYAVENEKKITITTETKALQKQLIEKDLSIIKEIFHDHLQLDFKYSLVLGSTNYPCKKRFELAVKTGSLSKIELKYAEKIKDLFQSKKIFTRFDITVSNNFWKKIHRESDACNSYRCPFAGDCSYQNAKKEWAKSDVLVMNHYLFFTNISSGKVYLPQTEIVIFDEAHSIAEIASNQLGYTLTHDLLLEILLRLYKKNRRNNLIKNISNSELYKRAVKYITQIITESDIYFTKCKSIFTPQKYNIRLTQKLNFGVKLLNLIKELILLFEEVEDDFKEDDIKLEFDIARGRLFLFYENFNSFVYMGNDDYVYWLEKSDGILIGDVTLRAQPIDVSDIIRREVIEYYDSSIFTSATLSLAGDFSFISKKLGIDDFNSIIFDTSFNFKSQVALFVDNKIKDPNSSQFISEAVDKTVKIIKILNGNCLLLFTSYKMLKEFHILLVEEIDNEIFSQDELPAPEASKRFLETDNSILMGTHSFWQGVDFQGDSLRGVIMMKLPFGVPDSPPVQAKIEKIKEKGENPFFSYQIPEAVIKFKQGFGRLIRSKKDIGIIALLDSRISSKGYGKIFLKNIPQSKPVHSISELKKEYKYISEKIND